MINALFRCDRWIFITWLDHGLSDLWNHVACTRILFSQWSAANYYQHRKWSDFTRFSGPTSGWYFTRLLKSDEQRLLGRTVFNLILPRWRVMTLSANQIEVETILANLESRWEQKFESSSWQRLEFAIKKFKIQNRLEFTPPKIEISGSKLAFFKSLKRFWV